jgi:hypothetical protein
MIERETGYDTTPEMPESAMCQLCRKYPCECGGFDYDDPTEDQMQEEVLHG